MWAFISTLAAVAGAVTAIKKAAGKITLVFFNTHSCRLSRVMVVGFSAHADHKAHFRKPQTALLGRELFCSKKTIYPNHLILVVWFRIGVHWRMFSVIFSRIQLYKV